MVEMSFLDYGLGGYSDNEINQLWGFWQSNKCIGKVMILTIKFELC